MANNLKICPLMVMCEAIAPCGEQDACVCLGTDCMWFVDGKGCAIRFLVPDKKGGA